MKTSKIIFISFFSFIGLFLLSVMILGIAFNGTASKKEQKKKQIISKSIKLDNTFRHINLAGEGNIWINKGDEQSLNYVENSLDSIPFVPEYDVRNDTLYVKSTYNRNVTIVVRNLNTVSGYSSHLHLSYIDLPSLKLSFENGNVRIEHNAKISNLYVSLSNNSNFRCNDFDIDTLKMNLNNSKFYFYGKKKLVSLEGTISNNSDVRLPKALHINLDVDSSSKIRMY